MKNSIKNYTDKVRKQSSEQINATIDQAIEESISYYSTQSKEAISERIAELDKEWDIERVIESNASSLALTGLLLGISKNKNWFILSGIVASFLFQHSVQGWSPPVPLFRKLKYRTRQEIDKEKYALKVLRGDFDKIADISSIESSERPAYALDAVK